MFPERIHPIEEIMKIIKLIIYAICIPLTLGWITECVDGDHFVNG
jgi:hypothetical protein